jgi:hypothetical protein
MHVHLLKKNALTSEEFFLCEKKLVLHLSNEHGQCVQFKVYARRENLDNYLIKCKGVYKGGHTATYRLPRSIGTLDELYSVVAERLMHTVAGVYKRDKQEVHRKPHRHRILTTYRYY